ncbi:conserved Plasmodium protein, unknown function [Plasmodium vinckei lentum]|uniref:SURF1-like protein n=1 Tax=Plasmodium vinckei lentum TaxID=138297 RepID=A0A6V7RZT4_PLAVN|nr:conserved Plasmodium protein, unknown function [Plasmodium vinckei lentum]
MPFLNNIQNVRKFAFQLNNNIFLCNLKGYPIGVFYNTSSIFFNTYNLKKKYFSILKNKRNKKKLSLFSKYIKRGHDTKVRNIIHLRKRKWGRPYKVHIDLLNEEIKCIEKKINERNLIKNDSGDISLTQFKYPSQKLYKAKEEEINLIRKSEGQYYLPLECENSTIVRIINIKNKISSPILRCVRNSKFGLREKEKTFFFFYSSFICSFFFLMGVWQYKKVNKKKFLINYILGNINKPIIDINDSDFPWFHDYLMLKEKIEKLNNDLALYEKENESKISNDITQAIVNVLEFWEKVKIYWEQEFNTTKSKNNNLNNNNDSISDSKNEENKNKLYNNINDTDLLTINFENIKNIHDWIIRIRNENFFSRFIKRKIMKNSITEEELKKLVIEKYKYRKVQLTGVLDTSNNFYIGPKFHEHNKKKKYYYVICPLFLKDGKCILVNRGLIAQEILKENISERPKIVTIRGILDPGELYECSFKNFKKVSNKNGYGNYFYYYDIENICKNANILNFEGSNYFIANIYDILVHEDYHNDIIKSCYSNKVNSDTIKDKDKIKELNDSLKELNNISIDDMDRETQERIKRLLKNNNIKTENKSAIKKAKPFRYDDHFIHKKKKEYFNFYADERTHFNYACQWFMFSIVFSTISIFKFIQFKRWVF